MLAYMRAHGGPDVTLANGTEAVHRLARRLSLQSLQA